MTLADFIRDYGELTAADLRLLAEVRELVQGRLLIMVQDGKPLRIEAGVQTKKLA